MIARICTRPQQACAEEWVIREARDREIVAWLRAKSNEYAERYHRARGDLQWAAREKYDLWGNCADELADELERGEVKP